MKTLFDSDRSALADSLRRTAETLAEYAERYDHWAIAFSGGKDSSACATAVCHLIDTGKVRRPKSLHVLYADTRMELPPLQISADAMLQAFRERGHDARAVLPAMDDRFMVYMLGRGVPPPKNRFRWCTSQLKIEPMQVALQELREQTGQKILMLTGVRIGESAARDQAIAVACGRDGAECGQGWYASLSDGVNNINRYFVPSGEDGITDTLAPILHWRTCHVWDWLMLHAPKDGFDTRPVATVYDQDAEGSKNEVGARTGCVGCPLASRDNALDRVLARPEWAYLAPLKRLRPLYVELTSHKNRLRKDGTETKADGSYVKNPGRVGPLKLEARLRALDTVLSIQGEINAAARQLGRPEYVLIDAEEEGRIRELIAANTWPNKWTGSELSGDVYVPRRYADGTVEHELFGD